MAVQLRGTQVVSLAGYQGSGKSTIGKKLARILVTDFIEVSDVVKQLHTGLNRDQLPSTGQLTKADPTWLGKAVGKSIRASLGLGAKPLVVLAGAREIEVHKYLQKAGCRIYGVHIDAEPDDRYLRLLKLNKIKTTEQFLMHELSEKRLGLDRVIETMSLVVPTSEDTDPEKLARGIKERLIKKGLEI